MLLYYYSLKIIIVKKDLELNSYKDGTKLYILKDLRVLQA